MLSKVKRFSVKRGRVLILWNQVDDDVVELWRRDNRRTPDWDPTKIVEPWDTVAEEVELIAKAITQAGHECIAININDNFETLLAALESERPDAVMNLVEWFHDDLENETHVPALFELLGISYTGNRPLALSLCQKKPSAKALLAAAGLPVPRGIVVEEGVAPADLDLRYPIIVKPAFDDASGGIDAGSVVRTRERPHVRASDPGDRRLRARASRHATKERARAVRNPAAGVPRAAWEICALIRCRIANALRKLAVRFAFTG